MGNFFFFHSLCVGLMFFLTYASDVAARDVLDQSARKSARRSRGLQSI